MMEMANFSNVADLDRLINNIEYENQQYWKLIEKEGQQIAALEKDIEENKRATEIIQDSVSQLDDNIKRSHKQFTQNRDNCESLKKSCAILKDHEEALEKKLITVIDQGKRESSEREDIMNHYRNILLDYEARYKSFPLAKVLEEKKKEVADLKNQIMESESNIQQIKSKIQQLEDFESGDYHNWNKFVIKIAELKINTENLKKQEMLLFQENKNINQKIDLARKKMLEEKKVQQMTEKEESKTNTEKDIQDTVPREVETDTSLNDINISIDQSDEEESTMISMYAGKEEAPDSSSINQENTPVSEMPITLTQHEQNIKYPNISIPQRVKPDSGVQINNQVTELRHDTTSHISTSMNSMEISNTGHINSNNTANNTLHSTAGAQDRQSQQVPQVSRSGPRLISHMNQTVSTTACFKSPSIPVMASPRPQTRLNVPNLTTPKMTKPDKRTVSIPTPNSSLRPLVNTTARYQHSIMSPKPYQSPVSPHVPALQHKTHTINSGRSFQTHNNGSSIPNQNVTKPQTLASQPFIKPRDVQVSPLLIPKSPRIPIVSNKKSSPDSPGNSHPSKNFALPQISQIPKTRTVPTTKSIPLSQNQKSPSSIPVPIQHVQQPSKSSPTQQGTTTGPHKANNSILIGTPQEKQTEKPINTSQTPSPDVAVPMDTSSSPCSSNSKTPEHRITSSPTSENWSPFNMEKHHQMLTELKSNKSPGVHLYDKRPMFNHSDDGKTSNKDEDFGSFMTSFFKSTKDGQKGGDFMMGSGDATEMTLFGRGGSSNFFGGASGLTSPGSEKTSEMSSGFNFGSSLENTSLQSMFGCEGNSSSESAEKETSFSFSFGRGGNSSSCSENPSSLTSLFGCSGGTNQDTGEEDKGFSFSFGGSGNDNSPKTHGFSLF